MNASETNDSKTVKNKKIPLGISLYFYFSNFVESLYGFWCRLQGREFIKYQGSWKTHECLLETKRIPNFFRIFRTWNMPPIPLEVYKMKCPGNEHGTQTTFYWHRWLKFLAEKPKCHTCERVLEIQNGDVKVTGKF